MIVIKGIWSFFWFGYSITITQITRASLFWGVHVKIRLSRKYTVTRLALVLTDVYLVVMPQQRCLEFECFTTGRTIKCFALTFVNVHNQRLFTAWLTQWLAINKIWSSVRYFCTYLQNRNQTVKYNKQCLWKKLSFMLV